jgi:hypothetical protein
MINPVLEARSVPNLRRAFATSPSGSLPAIACTTTQPSGAGVIAIQPVAGWSNRWLKLLPFGTGSDNDTFTLQVLGWSCVENLWVPVILFQTVCTLSTFVGLSGQPVTNTERFADTFGTPAKGTAGQDCVLISPADNTPSVVQVDCKGSQVVEVRVGGTAAGNALYAWM